MRKVYIVVTLIVLCLALPRQSRAVLIDGHVFSDSETFSVGRLDLVNAGGVIESINNATERRFAADRMLGQVTESILGVDFTVTSIRIKGGYYSAGVNANPNPSRYLIDAHNKRLYTEFRSGERAYWPGEVIINGVYEGVEQTLFRGILEGGFLIHDWATDCPPGMPYSMASATDNYGVYSFASIINLTGGALSQEFDGKLGFTGDFYAWLNPKYITSNALVGSAIFHRPIGSTTPPSTEVPEAGSMLLLGTALGLGRATRFSFFKKH